MKRIPSRHFSETLHTIEKFATVAKRTLPIFVLIFAALIVRLLLSPPIWNRGEAREGLVIQEIVRDQQWILPLRNGELPSKPPLFHWMAAVPAFLIGPSDFTVRLPSALAAAIMAITTYMMGRAMGGPATGWLALGALLGIYEFWDTGTQARVDMVFSACVVISLAGFFLWYRDGSKAARAACHIGAAFAVLAKGPAGLALPAIVILAFLVIEGRLKLLRQFWSWPLTAVILLVDVGWYASAYSIGGSEFFKLQIERENVDRALGTGRMAADDNFVTMAGWLLGRLFPASLVLFWSLIRRLRGEREDSAGRFLHVWWMSIFLVFALAAGKRAVYLVPIYPAISILAARAVTPLVLRWQRISETKASAPLSAQRYRPARIIGAAIVLMDLTLMLMTRNVWKHSTVEKARLAFINNVGTIVPVNTPIFATPELNHEALIVIAYRLHREIERKPIACAESNEYFLAPFEIETETGQGSRVLASSKKADVSLVNLPSARPGVHDKGLCFSLTSKSHGIANAQPALPTN
jgi:4-amino-4-deoxy-L-arabinose transferase-like glycosyltransferase